MANHVDRAWGVALRGLAGVIVVVAAIALIANPGFSQDKGPKAKEEGTQVQEKGAKVEDKGAKVEDKGAAAKGPSAPDMAEMMKKWQAFSTPGPQHKALDPFVGSWDLTVKSWMGGPNAPPTESKGTAEVKWILDGRYIEEKVKGEMSMPDETGAMKKVSYTGQGLTGYDNFKSIYLSTWADSMSTQVMLSKGCADATGKVFTFYAEVDDPMRGAHDQMMKSVARIIDKDKHVLEMYDLHTGENFKVMEITYTRK
jgi:hypothetical protein